MPVMNGNREEWLPQARMKRIVRKVQYEYIFLKTVHSLQELDAFRFQHFCKFEGAKRNGGNFTTVTLNCMRRSKVGGMCPFSLLAQRPFPKSSDIDVYKFANAEHNHPVKLEVARVAHRVPYKEKELAPDDADPPASFTTPNGRQWTFMETAKNLKEVNKFRLKHHCRSQKQRTRISMNCLNSTDEEECTFCLLALKTDRGRYNIYTNGQHTCRYANAENAAVDNTMSVKSTNAGKESEKVEAKEWPIDLIQRLLSVALREENAGLVDKLMAKTGQRRIGALLKALDSTDMIKLLQMAERESREGHGSKENMSYSADWVIWVREVLREVLLLLSLAQHSELGLQNAK